MEAELRDLEPADAAEYLEGLGVEEGGLRSLIQATYKQLGLYTYFTSGGLCITPLPEELSPELWFELQILCEVTPMVTCLLCSFITATPLSL